MYKVCSCFKTALSNIEEFVKKNKQDAYLCTNNREFLIKTPDEIMDINNHCVVGVMPYRPKYDKKLIMKKRHNKRSPTNIRINYRNDAGLMFFNGYSEEYFCNPLTYHAGLDELYELKGQPRKKTMTDYAMEDY